MYAVIQTGGKQYKVAVGDVLKIEKLGEDAGNEIVFDQVLLVNGDAGLKVGAPSISGSKVTATVKAQGRHKKVHIIKFKRRKHQMKKQGHRQYFTEVEITGISAE